MKVRNGFVSNSSSSSFVLLSQGELDFKKETKNIVLFREGPYSEEYAFLKDEECEEFLKHPEDYEYDNAFTGKRLNNCFLITPDMVGSTVQIEAFGIDEDSYPHTYLTLEDFKKQ